MKKDYGAALRVLERRIESTENMAKTLAKLLDPKLEKILEGIVKSKDIPKELRNPVRLSVGLDEDSGYVQGYLEYKRILKNYAQNSGMINSLFKREVYSKLGISEQYINDISLEQPDSDFDGK